MRFNGNYLLGITKLVLQIIVMCGVFADMYKIRIYFFFHEIPNKFGSWLRIFGYHVINAAAAGWG